MHFSDPDLYYKAIHEDSIPDVEAEEQGIVFCFCLLLTWLERPYWHQKMKAIPEFYEFVMKPLKLACYFYVRNNSVIPLVQWIMPSGHDNLIVMHSKKVIVNVFSIPSIYDVQRI